LLNSIVGIAKHLVIIIPEFISDQIVHDFDRPNVTFFIAGTLNYSTVHSPVYFCPHFFWSTTDFYRAKPEYLKSLNPDPVYSFDVLLGRRKPHRDILFENINRDQNVVRYFPSYFEGDIRQYSNTEFEWPILPPKDAVAMTAHEVTVGGTIVSLSQIIPYSIYNQTYYTLVAETCADNNFSFFTEKIVKPIIARRLFIVAAGQYYLRNLRALGFKTFNSIVDESYDNISDCNERMLAVIEQTSKLSKLDGNLVNSSISGIIEHNYQHMMKFDWQGSMIKNLSITLQLINNSIGDIHV